MIFYKTCQCRRTVAQLANCIGFNYLLKTDVCKVKWLGKLLQQWSHLTRRVQGAVVTSVVGQWVWETKGKEINWWGNEAWAPILVSTYFVHILSSNFYSSKFCKTNSCMPYFIFSYSAFFSYFYKRSTSCNSWLNLLIKCIVALCLL